MAAKITAPRVAFTSSRGLDMTLEAELAKRMGCAKPLWLRAAVKEFIDNALDACEESGIAPSITVTVDGCRLTVADNGPGMPPEAVAKLSNLGERMSSREAYAAPDRGAQGNAIFTLMHLPFAFAAPAGITIASRGVEHVLTLAADRLAGEVVPTYAASDTYLEPGTKVTMTWPMRVPADQVRAVLAEFAWLNPHATFQLDDLDPPPVDEDEYEDEVLNFWPSMGEVAKWPTKNATPAHWYSPERFLNRVRLELRRDRERTVAQFLGGFLGFTSSKLKAQAAEAAGLSKKPLAALLTPDGNDVDRGRVADLLFAMKEAAREPKHAVLGGVGKVSAERWLCKPPYNPDGEVRFFAFRTVDGTTDSGIPWRWEVGFAHLTKATKRRVLIGQNFAPAIDPGVMLNAILPNLPYHLGYLDPVALFMHRVSPARQALDYGKTKIDLDYDEQLAVVEAIEKMAAPWIKYANAVMRGKRARLEPEPKKKRVTKKAAVNRVLPECYAKVSDNGLYPAMVRQLYYAVRPRVLELTGSKEFAYYYFSQTLLPDFLRDDPRSNGWQVYCDARGTLTEPHTGRKVPLGTAEVWGYMYGWKNGAGLDSSLDFTIDAWDPGTSGPHNRYSAVIIVEKEGIADILSMVGIGRKYDVAIVGNKGHSVEAEYKLADRLNLPIFTLHDFDRNGLTIGANLRNGSKRHTYVNEFPVIELGLRLHQIEGLEDEPITDDNLKSVGDARLRECGATEDEIAFLRKRRVELNALTTGQLVEMVETALDDYGIKKVIPDADTLKKAWLAASVRCKIQKDVEEIVEAAQEWGDYQDAPDGLVDQVRVLLDKTPTLAWNDALLEIVDPG